MKEFPPCPVAAGRVRSLAPFDDQGYPFSAMKLGPGGGSRVQEMNRTVCVGDQMTHSGQKGFGMTKHGRSGHATRSPRFRFLQKLEAQKNDRNELVRPHGGKDLRLATAIAVQEDPSQKYASTNWAITNSKAATPAEISVKPAQPHRLKPIAENSTHMPRIDSAK